MEIARSSMEKRLRLRIGSTMPAVRRPVRPCRNLCAHVGGNLFQGGIVSLRAGQHRLGHRHHVAVPHGRGAFGGSGQDGVGDNAHQVVAFAQNRRAHTAHHGTNHSHEDSSVAYGVHSHYSTGEPGKKGILRPIGKIAGKCRHRAAVCGRVFPENRAHA